MLVPGNVTRQLTTTLPLDNSKCTSFVFTPADAATSERKLDSNVLRKAASLNALISRLVNHILKDAEADDAWAGVGVEMEEGGGKAAVGGDVVEGVVERVGAEVLDSGAVVGGAVVVSVSDDSVGVVVVIVPETAVGTIFVGIFMRALLCCFVAVSVHSPPERVPTNSTLSG